MWRAGSPGIPSRPRIPSVSREREQTMQPKIPADPPPTPYQREDLMRRPRAGAATQSVPPANEDGPTADERLDGGPLESAQLFRATFDRAVIGIAHVSPQ